MSTDTAAPPLSHSSASTLQGCEQRYVHYKVLRTPEDPDYEKSEALAIGSAVHWILEKSKHEKPASISTDLAICVRDPTIGLREEDVPLVHAMVLTYLRLRKRVPLRVLAVEVEIRTDWMLGYVDIVEEEEDGSWWITDVKTWKTLNDAQVKQLPKDPQLNLYAGHHEVVAELLGLLPEKFAGVRWRVVTKTSAKQKAGEDYLTYVKRLADKHLEAHDIPVPRVLLHPGERLAEHRRLWERSAVLIASGGVGATKNYKTCFDFFSPCQFWSACHGQTFSDDIPLNITTEKGAKK